MLVVGCCVSPHSDLATAIFWDASGPVRHSTLFLSYLAVDAYGKKAYSNDMALIKEAVSFLAGTRSSFWSELDLREPSSLASSVCYFCVCLWLPLCSVVRVCVQTPKTAVPRTPCPPTRSASTAGPAPTRRASCPARLGSRARCAPPMCALARRVRGTAAAWSRTMAWWTRAASATATSPVRVLSFAVRLLLFARLRSCFCACLRPALHLTACGELPACHWLS